MSHSKPLLIPWLRTQIDSGKYPGVLWTNAERTEFSIPWKHALRQDSSDIDILIFKAWAEVSGSSRPHGDPSVWKRNFRSALRAKGFKLLSDSKNDAANPHKVFRWPDESASGANSSAGSQVQDDPGLLEHLCLPTQESRAVPCFDLPEATVFAANSSAGSQVQDDPDLYEHLCLPIQESRAVPCFEDCLCLPEDTAFAESTVDQDILQECLKGLNIGPEAEGTAVFEPPPEQQHLQNTVAIGGPALPGQQQYPVAFEGAVGEAGLPEQPACPMDGAVGGAFDGQFAEQFLHMMAMASNGDNFKTQFRISVYYRGVMVSEQLVENEVGFRLVYRPGLIGQTIDHESGLSLVSLPSPGTMLDNTQANLTQRILDMLGDGVDVGVSGHVVYGQRRGEIKAFWSFSKFDRSRQPQEISKLQPQPLYLFKDFLRGILDFIDGRDSPPCSLFLCLGEKWPDPDNRPWEKKLITVEVVLTSMELLKNIAVGGGASSLQSVELQMSLEELMEMY